MICTVVWSYSRSKYRRDRMYYNNYCFYDYDVDLYGELRWTYIEPCRAVNGIRPIPYLSMRSSFGVCCDYSNSNFEFMSHECLYQG
jgi:hypothetical protein